MVVVRFESELLNLFLDEIEENYFGNKDTIFFQYASISKVSEKFTISVKTVSNN